MKHTGLLCILAILFLPFSGLCQWYIIAGYDISYEDSPQLNQLVDAFNNKYPDITDDMKHFNVMHGVIAGGRYDFGGSAIEIGYKRRFSRNIADDVNFIGIDTFGNSNIDVFFDVGTWYTSMEWGIETVTIGAGIDYNIYKYKVGFGDSPLIDYKLKRSTWGSKVFLNFELSQSKSIGYGIKPYFQWSWDTVTIEPFADKLVGEGTCFPCKEKPYSFGISFLIYNGR
jgi:hypothetical protein